MSENSIEFSLSNSEQRDSWLNSGHQTLDADIRLANYYRRFIKDFAKMAAPLHVLVRKEQKWKWEGEQEEAFRRLKEVFTTEPVLAILNIDREMRVEVDALDYVMGGVLSMKCEDGKWRPVAFISKLLNTTE